MNLYKLHSDPTSLLHHDIAHEKVPAVFWDKYKDNPEELKKREAAIAKDPQYAYRYAYFVLEKSFPAGEAAIAKDPYYAYRYASDVLKKPFPAGEAAIAKDPRYARLYVRDVLKKDFYLNGKLIAKKDK